MEGSRVLKPRPSIRGRLTQLELKNVLFFFFFIINPVAFNVEDRTLSNWEINHLTKHLLKFSPTKLMLSELEMLTQYIYWRHPSLDFIILIHIFLFFNLYRFYFYFFQPSLF